MNAGSAGEFIATRELCRRLGVSKKLVRRRIENGTWKRGREFFRPPASQFVWRWSRIVEWIETEGRSSDIAVQEVPVIQFASAIRRNGAAA